MNLLPLDSFREIMGFNPWHFWQLSNSKVPVTSSCNSIVREYAWQGTDAIGRSEIRQAIETAERRLLDYLGYTPAPEYLEETLPYPQFHQVNLDRLYPEDATGHWLPVTLSRGQVRKVGIETLTAIETANVVYSDADGDGLNETATITTALPLGTTNPEEIACYFIAADRLDSEPASEKYRISPLKVTIAGGIATIKGKSWLFVKPLEYQGVGLSGIDPDTAANFASTVEVKRRWTNQDGITTDTCQAVLIWETLPFPPWGRPLTTDSDPASIAQTVARAGIRNAELGIVTPAEATYNAATATWSSPIWCDPARPPDRVKLRYLSGAATVDGVMSQSWRLIVARLAAAEMERPICACEVANRELYAWQFDLSRAAGVNDEQYRIGDEDLNNPFGPRRGAVYAWQRVKSLALERGILV